MFSLIYAWINGWVNNREAGDLRRHRAHYDAIVMNNFNVFATKMTLLKMSDDISPNLTDGYHYNAIQYNMVLHTTLQWLRQNIKHSLNS